MDTDERRETDLRETLADLASVEMQMPEGMTDSVLAAVETDGATRRRAARLAVIRARERAWGAGRRSVAGAADWGRRNRALRNGALASSAIVVGAVAIGLEARHVRRSREETAA